MFKIIYVFLCLSVLGEVSCEEQSIVNALHYRTSLFPNKRVFPDVESNSEQEYEMNWSKDEAIINYIWYYVCKQTHGTKQLSHMINYRMAEQIKRSSVKVKKLHTLLILALAKDPNAQSLGRDHFKIIREEAAAIDVSEEHEVTQEFSKYMGRLKFCPNVKEYELNHKVADKAKRDAQTRRLQEHTDRLAAQLRASREAKAAAANANSEGNAPATVDHQA